MTAQELIEKIKTWVNLRKKALHSTLFNDEYNDFLSDLEKECEDFPTTDEEMAKFLATHPKVELPEKYKTPDWMLEKSEKPTIQEQPVMIRWTGNNLKEVIEFTGKSPRFNEWFKTWDEYESYVHSHGNIFKMFNDDGSHLEVPVGAWIVKTPDKRCVASKFTLKQPESEKIAAAYQLGLADKEKKMMKEAVKGWVARDGFDNTLCFFSNKPHRPDIQEPLKVWKMWLGGCFHLPKQLFPDLKWEDEPKKVKLIIVKED